MTNEELMDAAMYEIVRCTIPFYGWVDGCPVQNGTGVLLQIGDLSFVLAAAHVLDYPAIHGISYLTINEHGHAVPLHLKKVITSPVPPGCQPKASDMRDDDPWDIGIAELSLETANNLRTFWRFAQLRQIDLGCDTQRGTFLVAGYPLALTHSNVADRTTDTKVLRYITGIYDGDREDRDTNAQLLLEYPEHNVTSGGDATGVPQPRGLSGCGIWRLNDNVHHSSQWQSSDLKLVGIQHRWRQSRRYLVGTRVRYALQLICKYYPELHAAMNLVFSV